MKTLKSCGRFAAVSPPVMTLLLSTYRNSAAIVVRAEIVQGKTASAAAAGDGGPNGKEDG
ncbi:hypothetical protein [Bradyrhizobium sp. 23]|uniref:hypothetical protein n=1 Tax=Bradyrhizobium sp. 23 TaxID=2782667 RepID=UPI001FFC0C9F